MRCIVWSSDWDVVVQRHLVRVTKSAYCRSCAYDTAPSDGVTVDRAQPRHGPRRLAVAPDMAQPQLPLAAPTARE